MISNDPFNQFYFRTTIEYDFDQLKWTYFEFGFYKRYVKEQQWINYNHSLMHDPVYPVLNDRLVYYKNWMTDQYTLSAFSSIWPFKVVVNQDNIDEPLSERIHELFGSRTSRLLCVDPRLSELITANVICKSGDELSILNESITFDLAYQKCHEDNSTFRK